MRTRAASYVGLLALNVLRLPQTRMIGLGMLGILVVQIGLGIANLVLHLPLVLAVAHNLGAALLLLTIVVLNSKLTEPS